MLTLLPNRTRKRDVSVLGVPLLLLTGSAQACQLCASVGFYNAFRFVAVWFWLQMVWMVVAGGTDIQVRRRNPGRRRKRSELLVWPSVVLLICAIVAGFFLGLQLAVFLFAPVLWLRVLFPRMAGRRSPSGEDSGASVPAPAHLRVVAAALLLVAAVSPFTAYTLLPPLEGETEVRQKVFITRNRMKQLAAATESIKKAKTGATTTLLVESDGNTYSAIDPSALSSLNGSQTIAASALEDPFAYRGVSNPPAAIAAFFPFWIFAPSEILSTGPRLEFPFIRDTPSLFRQIQCYPLNGGNLFRARGPDTVYSLSHDQMVALQPLIERSLREGTDLTDGETFYPPDLATVTYDATNGTFSAGDLFLLRIAP